MKQNVYAVHDGAAGAYLNPIYQHTDGMMIRMFRNAVNDPTHAFGQHPADYTLFKIGKYCDETGQHIPETPQSLGNGIEHVTNESTDS